MHRKNDLTEATLNILAVEDAGRAERLFYQYKDCTFCYNNCKARTLYSFRGQQKMTCHGRLELTQYEESFKDVKKIVGVISDILSA